MTDHSDPAPPPGLGFCEIATIILFGVGVIGWLSQMDLLQRIAGDWLVARKVGDEGIGLMVYGPAMLVISFVLLLASIAASKSADRLPRWLRVMTVALPALGCLAGAAIIYRVVSG